MAVFLISALFLSSFYIPGKSQVDISIFPASVEEGQNVTVSCVSQISAFAVSLFINMEDTLGNSRVSGPVGSQTSNRNFTFISVQRNDSNLNFTCRSNQGGGSGTFSEVAKLDVQFAPTFRTQIMDGYGVEGGSATIMFSVDANPQVTENDISVSPARSPPPSISVDELDVIVVYENLQRSDSATYTVQVANSVDSVSRTFQLDVFFGPDFSNSSTEITVVEGQTLVIDCSISATNPAVTSITISGSGVSETLNISNSVFVQSLVTTNYTGSYICIATNGQINNTKEFTVAVNEVPTSTSLSSSQSDNPTATLQPTTVGESEGLSNEAIGGIAGGISVAVLIVGIGGGGVGVYLYWKKKGAARA